MVNSKSATLKYGKLIYLIGPGVHPLIIYTMRGLGGQSSLLFSCVHSDKYCVWKGWGKSENCPIVIMDQTLYEG